QSGSAVTRANLRYVESQTAGRRSADSTVRHCWAVKCSDTRRRSLSLTELCNRKGAAKKAPLLPTAQSSDIAALNSSCITRIPDTRDFLVGQLVRELSLRGVVGGLAAFTPSNPRAHDPSTRRYHRGDDY